MSHNPLITVNSYFSGFFLGCNMIFGLFCGFSAGCGGSCPGLWKSRGSQLIGFSSEVSELGYHLSDGSYEMGAIDTADGNDRVRV